jgi:aspartyl-tRNA(Asn)/glutamyl-tRNA(Gln) amidotransferase subunit C
MNIDYVAKLARLELSGEEKEKYGKQLTDILQYIEKLNKLDTSNIEPTAHAIAMKNVWREDIVKPSLDRDGLQKIMPMMKDGFFKVPPIIEQ